MSTRTILVVEDDPLIRLLLQEVLEEAGYPIELVDDGARALDVIHASPPALILLDLILPSLTGAAIIMHIHANETLRAIPIIVMTAHQELPEPLRPYVHTMFRKPFDVFRLLALIGELVSPEERCT
jgi:CheY-like chemotaxis protein